MRVAVGNAQHIGVRNEQHDAFAVSNLSDLDRATRVGALAVVAGGMGGMRAGGEVSRAAVAAFLESHRQAPRETALSDVLTLGLGAANQAVPDVARRGGVEGNAGATLVAAIVRGDELHWVACGDSNVEARPAAGARSRHPLRAYTRPSASRGHGASARHPGTLCGPRAGARRAATHVGSRFERKPARLPIERRAHFPSPLHAPLARAQGSGDPRGRLASQRTFVRGGQRLEARRAAPLRDRERFCVGGPDHVFEISIRSRNGH